MCPAQSLTEFQAMESGGRDVGLNVRSKARQLLDLLKDRPRIDELRERAATAGTK